MVGSDSARPPSNNSIAGMENDADATLHNSKFKDWRLKLHNDVVHLYKAGNSEAETPKVGGGQR